MSYQITTFSKMIVSIVNDDDNNGDTCRDISMMLRIYLHSKS